MSDVDVRRTTETGPTPTLRPFKELAPLAPPAVHSPSPLVPAWLASILGGLAAVGGFAAGLLSSPASWVVASLAVLLALVAGVTGFQVPDFTVGRPVVKGAWIGPLTTFAGLLVNHASTLPEGYLKGLLLMLAIVCAGAAGVPLPRPSR